MPAATTKSIVLPGNYDGVHLGHRGLLGQALAHARTDGARVTVLTFDPHPAAFFRRTVAKEPLTTCARRKEILVALGASDVVVQRFDERYAETSAAAFVREQLVRDLGARAVVVGDDYRFGKGREGDVAMLRVLGAPIGLEVVVVPPVTLDGAIVSSTRVREALRNGDASDAARALGRYHDVSGRVIHGAARGRTIGVPTANLDVEPVLLPRDGVYAVAARIQGDTRLLRGVANLGVRPTLAAGRSAEVHLFDFDEDLYDRTLRVAFVARLRDEQRFDGLDALKAAIAKDIELAKDALTQWNEGWLAWM